MSAHGKESRKAPGWREMSRHRHPSDLAPEMTTGEISEYCPVLPTDNNPRRSFTVKVDLRSRAPALIGRFRGSPALAPARIEIGRRNDRCTGQLQGTLIDCTL